MPRLCNGLRAPGGPSRRCRLCAVAPPQEATHRPFAASPHTPQIPCPGGRDAAALTCRPHRPGKPGSDVAAATAGGYTTRHVASLPSPSGNLPRGQGSPVTQTRRSDAVAPRAPGHADVLPHLPAADPAVPRLQPPPTWRSLQEAPRLESPPEPRAQSHLKLCTHLPSTCRVTRCLSVCPSPKPECCFLPAPRVHESVGSLWLWAGFDAV